VTPIRLAVIIVLVYLLYRLIVGPRKKPADMKSWGKPGGNREKPTQDVLVRDPVCQVYIPKSQAIVAEYDKQQYHFCSEKCREKFLVEKEKSEKE